VLAAEPDNADAKRVAVEAHTLLLSDSGNFGERAWLLKKIAELGGSGT
jgi:hypothetical protein